EADSLPVSLFRCAVEFRRVAGWSCEVRIRKLLWSDHCFEFCIFS
ncbi:hypothetical protein LINPERHAP1_LOCUS19010, partial [Linum perenne]